MGPSVWFESSNKFANKFTNAVSCVDRPCARSLCCHGDVSPPCFHLNSTHQPVCVSLQPENSSAELSRSVLYSGSVDPSQWVGLRKTDGKLLDYLRVRRYSSGTLGGAVAPC